jgi:hypothetical protein
MGQNGCQSSPRRRDSCDTRPVPDQATESASRYSMRDLEFEISDRLWDLYRIYWDPIDNLADQYLAFLESKPRIIKGLESLAGMNRDDDKFFELIDELASVEESHVDQWLDAEVQLEDRHQARRNLVVGHIAIRVSDRFVEKYANLHTAHSAFEAFEWVGVTIAGGVLGNLSYDLLKKGWGTSWRSIIRRLNRRPVPSGVDPDEALVYLVKIAIREQCRRVQFPVPDVAALNITGWRPGAQSVVADVSSSSPELQAIVEVPYFGLDAHGVRVSVSRASD